MSEKRTGYATITYKLRLYDRHLDWIVSTRQIYNQVVWHYYQMLMRERSLLEQGNFLVLRALEEQSIGTKAMRARKEEPPWKLPDVPKVPLYFRRAAINTAIGLARSYVTSCEKKKQKTAFLAQKEEVLFSNPIPRNMPSPTEKIDCSPVFYKGMYREFTETSIQLKLFNGTKWVWVTYPYTGRAIPKDGTILSPTLKLEKKTAYLHVPVETIVEDVRTVRERMEKETRLCAVSFPDQDTLAVCVVLDRSGSLLDSYFIHGGRAREAQRKVVLERLKKRKDSRKRTEFLREEKFFKAGSSLAKKVEREQVDSRVVEEIEREQVGSRAVEKAGRENGRLYQKLRQINTYYAHQVSRKILNYCKEQQIKLIVVPNYEQPIPFSAHPYLHTNSFRWQGRAIIRNLKYKAWKEGILVTTIRPYHIADCCSECGRTIQRYNEGHKASKNYYGGKLFLCPNGHRGNAALNTAKNIGRYFLRRFQEEFG